MRRKRWVHRAVGVVILLIVAECVARYGLGLGDPPLYITDPQLEYIAAPSRGYLRFGNRIAFNAYSMRSDEVAKTKTDPRELRILFLGDSILNGGNWTDQSQLATELIRSQLAKALDRPITVCNVSTGSWGPGNLLAYVKKYGFFDADAVVIVMSSHDYADHPTFEPTVGVLPGIPDRSPLFALEEVFTRYLPLYIHIYLYKPFETPQSNPSSGNTGPAQETIDRSLHALRELIELARATGAPVLLAQHLEEKEPLGNELPGHEAIAQLALKMGIQPIELGPAFKQAIAEHKNPYRDWIHPNALGHELIAQTLFDPIRRALDPIITQ